MITFQEWLDINLIAKKANLDISKYSLKQIRMGMKVELEHGKKDPQLNVTNNDPIKTLKIALAHLKEDPNYYTKLKEVEK